MEGVKTRHAPRQDPIFTSMVSMVTQECRSLDNLNNDGLRSSMMKLLARVSRFLKDKLW